MRRHERILNDIWRYESTIKYDKKKKVVEIYTYKRLLTQQDTPQCLFLNTIESQIVTSFTISRASDETDDKVEWVGVGDYLHMSYGTWMQHQSETHKNGDQQSVVFDALSWREGREGVPLNWQKTIRLVSFQMAMVTTCWMVTRNILLSIKWSLTYNFFFSRSFQLQKRSQP